MNGSQLLFLSLQDIALYSLATFIAFFVPGYIILRYFSRSLNSFVQIIASYVVGMTCWGIQGFLFGWLSMRWGTYIYLLFFSVCGIQVLHRNFPSKQDLRTFIRSIVQSLDGTLICLIVLGVILQGSSVFLLGVPVNNALYFCCGNTNDNLFHAALTNQLITEFPPQQPGMIGEYVKNYHYLGNVISAELIRIFHLPLFATTLRTGPLMISLLLGFSAIAFSISAHLNKLYQRWLLFFLYFGGDFIYLATSYMRRTISFDMTSLEDGAIFLVNPPRAISIIVFFTSLSLFLHWIKKRESPIGFLSALLFGTLISLKVYTGAFALGGLFLLAIYGLVKRKLMPMSMFSVAFIVALSLYLPVNRNAGGLYFTGFGLFQNFIVQPILSLEKLELARVIFLNDQKLFRVFQFNMLFMAIYIVSIFGTKLIGIFQTKKSLSQLPLEFHLFMVGGILPSAILGFFFQQTSGGSNSFNFLVSLFIIGSIYTALSVTHILNSIKYSFLKIVMSVMIIVFTVPRVIYIFHGQINRILRLDGFIIHQQELDFYSHASTLNLHNKNILTDPSVFTLDQQESPYVSIFISHPTYFSGSRILKSHNIDVTQRERQVETIFSATHSAEFITLMKNSPVDYILTSNTPSMNTSSLQYFNPVYTNSSYSLLEIKPSPVAE